MNPVLAQWLPAIFIVLAVWVGLLYNNKRLDDFKDLMKAAIGQAKAEMQTQIMESEKRVLQANRESEQRILEAIGGLERRIGRLEAPFIRS